MGEAKNSFICLIKATEKKAIRDNGSIFDDGAPPSLVGLRLSV